MSIKKVIDQVVNLGYLLFTDMMISPLKTFTKETKELYYQNKLKAIAVILTVFLLFFGSCLVSYKLFIERSFGQSIGNQSNSRNATLPIQTPSNPTPSNPTPLIPNSKNLGAIGGVVINGSDSQVSDGKERAAAMYLDTYVNFLSYVGDFFEDYISTTVDPLGHATANSTEISFEPVVNKNSKLQFASSDNSGIFYSAYRYASIILGVVTPILVLLVIITGLQILMARSNHVSFEKLTQKLTRIAITVVLILVGMPLLLTSSVMVTNLFNRLILNSTSSTGSCPTLNGADPTFSNISSNSSSKKDLKCYLQKITEQIRKQTIPGNDNQPKEITFEGWDLGNIIKVQSQNFWGFFQIAPLVLLTAFMLILLFVIFIQFVIRYLQIYFLFAIYPIVAVMWYNHSTAKYFSEYWKQLVTLLIQQPVFLLCFVIFGDISINLLSDIANPAKASSLLIFAIYLVFLATVPQALTARIFGDVFAYQSGQDFSDKVNYVGHKTQAGFDTFRQKTKELTSAGIRNSPRAVKVGASIVGGGAKKAGGFVKSEWNKSQAKMEGSNTKSAPQTSSAGAFTPVSSNNIINSNSPNISGARDTSVSPEVNTKAKKSKLSTKDDQTSSIANSNFNANTNNASNPDQNNPNSGYSNVQVLPASK